MSDHRSDFDAPLHERFDELTPEVWDLPDHLDDLQHSLARQAGGVLRRRRVVRHVGRLSLAVLLYGLGVLTAVGWHELTGPTSDTESPEQPHQIARGPDHREPPSEASRGGEFGDLSPEEIERRARVGSSRRRAERWKRAGDLHLELRGDVDNALRCYREYLTAAPPAEHVRRSEDTWLLNQLKTDLD